MSVSIHYTTAPKYGARATAYLKDDYNDKRWATVKIVGKDGYTEKACLYLHEDTIRQMLTALTAVVAEFDEQVATETAEVAE
jgi:hypothetical protein